jgi:hypothetical protein
MEMTRRSGRRREQLDDLEGKEDTGKFNKKQ